MMMVLKNGEMTRNEGVEMSICKYHFDMVSINERTHLLEINVVQRLRNWLKVCCC